MSYTRGMTTNGPRERMGAPGDTGLSMIDRTRQLAMSQGAMRDLTDGHAVRGLPDPDRGSA